MLILFWGHCLKNILKYLKYLFAEEILLNTSERIMFDRLNLTEGSVNILLNCQHVVPRLGDPGWWLSSGDSTWQVTLEAFVSNFESMGQKSYLPVGYPESGLFGSPSTVWCLETMRTWWRSILHRLGGGKFLHWCLWKWDYARNVPVLERREMKSLRRT